MAKLKPINVDWCLENVSEVKRLRNLLGEKNTSGRNMVVVDWIYGRTLTDESILRLYAPGAFIGLSYRTYPAIKKLFLLNGYKVNPPSHRNRTQNHPLGSFPFQISLEITTDQIRWLKSNHWSVIKLNQ